MAKLKRTPPKLTADQVKAKLTRAAEIINHESMKADPKHALAAGKAPSTRDIVLWVAFCVDQGRNVGPVRQSKQEAQDDCDDHIAKTGHVVKPIRSN